MPETPKTKYSDTLLIGRGYLQHISLRLAEISAALTNAGGEDAYIAKYDRTPIDAIDALAEGFMGWSMMKPGEESNDDVVTARTAQESHVQPKSNE